MEIESRKTRILSLREQGETIVNIGRIFGISHQRVSKIYQQAKEEKLLQVASPFGSKVSTRSRNGLKRYFNDPKILDKPHKIAAAGARRLKYAYQLGPKSLGEIALALQTTGLIESKERWLENI